jgi:bifunctional DNA-binding transcriptional regulator/antitoxin component of YhaV-PrlF toxin-antitoxin module
MDLIIPVRTRCTITLPAELRGKYGIDSGDSLRLVDLDGTFVLTPVVTMVPELALGIEKARREVRLGIEESLEGIREQRDRYQGGENDADETQ